jgi:hypothetical protein
MEDAAREPGNYIRAGRFRAGADVSAPGPIGGVTPKRVGRVCAKIAEPQSARRTDSTRE